MKDLSLALQEKRSRLQSLQAEIRRIEIEVETLTAALQILQTEEAPAAAYKPATPAVTAYSASPVSAAATAPASYSPAQSGSATPLSVAGSYSGPPAMSAPAENPPAAPLRKAFP
jgi:hypothetical protein